MHQNNPTAAIRYWEMVKNGTSRENSAKSFHTFENGEWKDINCGCPPNFSSINEIRKKPKHLDLMQEYERYAKDDPEEWMNWECSSLTREWWTRVNSTPLWLDDMKYRRKPLPKPDENGWHTIDSDPNGVPVDIVTRSFDHRMVIVSFSIDQRWENGMLKDICGKHIEATHWRPATKPPACYYENDSQQ